MFDAIGIPCKNVKRSIEFYQNFGLSFKEFGDEHFEATTSSGVRIMLDSFELMKKINPSWIEPKGPGMVLCFKQESSNEVDSLFSKIKDKGFEVVKEPWDAFWGQRYCSVKDPDGNQIDIFSNLEEK